MKTRTLSWILMLLTAVSFSCHQGDENDKTPEPDPDNANLILPEGFSAFIIADDLGRGRHLVVRDNGDVYLALRTLDKGNGIVAMRDTSGDGRMDIIEYFGQYPGTGIDIRGDYLYFASDTAVMRYKFKENELLPEPSPEIIAGGFILQYQHAVKPFTFDGDGNMYVNAGGPSNACMEQMRTPGSAGQDPCPQLERQAGIWRFKADVPGQKQVEDGYHYATGIRNAVALDWNFHSNHLYVVQHGRDQLHQFFPELYTEDDGVQLPAEEFFLVEDGDDFGWPYCYYDQFREKKVLAPEYGGDGERAGRCADMKDPIMAFPGHVAPNDLMFYTGEQFPARYKYGAFIAFHGSWNRAPQEQEGYYVVFVPFEGALPSGPWEVFADNFAGRETVMQPGQAEHRPMGIDQGPDGSLYISDSVKGTIWRIMYSGN